MARGQRKTIEEKISEKEEMVRSLQIRIKSEQEELEVLYKDKRLKDLEIINETIKAFGLNECEVSEALELYISSKNKHAS